MIVSMKAHTAEFIEGPAAFRKFREAVKRVMTVPKSSVPNPFSAPKPQKKKPARKS